MTRPAVGAYQLGEKLGEGGMGVVYAAFDPKLQRQVAIKFLLNPIGDQDAFVRFQRETRLASSLNHPNILTVHDAGDADGTAYLVTEFVDGGTLEDWATAEARSWRQVVEMLIGIADALATAHQAGVIHRDVKPGNVLVSKSGYAKLADFGLAKPLHDSDEKLTRGTTRAGVVVGTVSYMSPEQTLAKPLDARSDIFSFGVVLYELLAGRRPFAGASSLEELHAIMHAVPPSLGFDVPASVRMIVEKALEKDPADRYQTMREVVVDLRRAARRTTEAMPISESTARTARSSRRTSMSIAAAIGLVMIGALIGRWLFTAGGTSSGPLVPRFQRMTDAVGVEESPAVSPDGKTIAFVAAVEGRRQIWIRLLAGGPAIQLSHDDVDHESPRWTPDSSALIYYTPPATENESGAAWEISALGGSPRRLASVSGGLDVSHDGQHIAAFQQIDGRASLAVLRRDGTPSSTTRLPALNGYATPRWSPDDRRIAFVANLSNFAHAIFLAAPGQEPIEAHRTTEINGIAWLQDGSGLVFASASGSTLRYPPILSLRRLSLATRTEQQLTVGDTSYQEPDIDRTGRLFASRVTAQSDIWRFPVSGTPAENVANGLRVTRQTGHVRTPSASPDGQHVAYLSDSGGHSNLWIARVDGTETRQLTFEPDPNLSVGIPNWSPRGDRIAFVTASLGIATQWLISPDASDRRPLAETGPGASWSPDGAWLYFQVGEDLTTNPEPCVHKIPAAGGNAVRVRCGASTAALSVDGTLYFSPSALRQNEILKANPEDAPAVPLTRYPASRLPLWPQHFVVAADGKSLVLPLLDRGTTNVWAIPVDGGPFRQITDFGRRSILIARQVSLTRDGRFVFAAVMERDADIVLFDGLAR